MDTIDYLQKQERLANEILVVDQTPDYPADVKNHLHDLDTRRLIRWIRLEKPSITAAMNRGLIEAKSDIVLFLDDDIIPSKSLVGMHLTNYAHEEIWAVVGQILQPGQVADETVPKPYSANNLLSDLDFRFNGTHRRQIFNCMAGNLSVRRNKGIEVGGMDMNFKGVAFRFETEFARRLTLAGGKVLFDPAAGLEHLQAPSGGTRTYGNPLTSASPVHNVGDYYMALRLARGYSRWKYFVKRMFRSVRTRFHLTHPWWIPVKLVGETRGFLWAWRLHRKGPLYIRSDSEN